LDFIKNHFDRIVSHDQDVLNYVLQDEKENVGITYNFLENYLYKPEVALYDYYKYKKEIDLVKKDPAIIHYVASKPWIRNCKNPYKDIFLDYRKETLWKNCTVLKEKISIRSRIKSILMYFRLIKPQEELFDNNEISNIIPS
jgi:lipopolysaccharide biosynthesis glycosyltransferase